MYYGTQRYYTRVPLPSSHPQPGGATWLVGGADPKTTRAAKAVGRHADTPPRMSA